MSTSLMISKIFFLKIVIQVINNKLKFLSEFLYNNNTGQQKLPN